MNELSGNAVRVKICGVTNCADAEAAIALGADALGFNFYAGSRRHISLPAESGWMRQLPPFVTRVAVLVNVPLEEARAIARHPAIDMVQFHGDEDEAYCGEFAQLGRAFIKAVRLADSNATRLAARFSTRHVLLDAHTPGAYGGTGTAIDLELAATVARAQPGLALILAGGLTPETVSEAVRRVRPFAVDVASGVEKVARSKDAALMRAFIKNARFALENSLK